MFVVSFAIGLGEIKSLAISGDILTEANVTVGFFELSLW